ncbi:sensor histidine kinase [Actinoplanes awajinensis]|uniref:histidine kinase n=1 Tax=Actinoplanes awajinensis subsp. mycoplanecinus TaxID=135947 RepID=A0A124G807_9ACTN|nr:ATP-binding protein [Actinoplanes awajinensis]KUL24416.1 histidine kinase [Actinoplanes awajinensis subsp. mycoplanecinus]
MLQLLRRRLGVRMRSAIAAGIVVIVASLGVGAILLVTARGILLDNVTTAANDRAAQVTTALTSGNTGALEVALRTSRAGRSLAQVVTTGGEVVGASAAIEGAAAMSTLRPAVGRRLTETKDLRLGEGEPWRILAIGVDSPSGQRVVLVAESMDAVADSTEAILTAMLLGLPVLAVVVGVATFLFVGRTLRPVEAMRRQAATITATNLHARLPLPAADDEIAALATTMNTMLDRIETSAAAQRRFVSDASHELRSPLTTIRANADLLAGAVRKRPPAVEEEAGGARNRSGAAGEAVGEEVGAVRNRASAAGEETGAVRNRSGAAGEAAGGVRGPAGAAEDESGVARAERDDADERSARSIERIRAESARMSRLVEDLLLLARVDDQPAPPRHEDVDLDDLVFAERERVGVEHPALRIEGGVSPVRVVGDPDQLTRVLRNLVDNTVRHARERVTIGVGARDGHGEIVVGNDGPAIPAADRERIFDRFVRLDDSRSREGGGAGLGLAIAREIITAHQGTLTIDDLAEGAAMRMRLPVGLQ